MENLKEDVMAWTIHSAPSFHIPAVLQMPAASHKGDIGLASSTS